jgi:hypothetical protein
MADVPDETIDRLLAGRASGRRAAPHRAGGARRSDLFEQLTAAGVVTNSVDDETRTAPPRPEQFQRRPRLAVDPPRVVVMTLALAAAIVLAVAIGRREVHGTARHRQRRHGASGPRRDRAAAAVDRPCADAASPPAFRARRARAAFPGRPERSSRCTTASSISIWGRSTD